MNYVATVGLVVPALTGDGGVPAVAEYLCGVIERSGRYRYRLISLPTGSRDPTGTQLTRPSTWLRGVIRTGGMWRNREYVQIGASMTELEFQRYRPRAALSRELHACDLIQVVTGIPAPALATLNAGRPVVLQVATLTAVERRRWISERRSVADGCRRLMTWIVSRLDARVLRNVSAIMVENPWMLQHCKETVGARRVAVQYAPPGIDTDFFVPAAKAEPQATPYILCVGRLDDPRKNIELLIRAFGRSIQARASGAALILAGASAPDSRALALIDALGLRDRISVEVGPTAARLLQLYQHAHCFALPSDEEGLGLVLLEAMSCGLAVIATRCGGPEGIVEHGVDGLLVERDDEEGLARMLDLVLGDAAFRWRLGAKARRTAVNRYSLAATGAAFLAVYDALLAALPSPGRV